MLAQPAAAKIIYTKADVAILNGTILNLDNRHRGQFTFTVRRAYASSGFSFIMSVFPIGNNNRIWGTNQAASALHYGRRIGPNTKKFAYGNDFMGLDRSGVFGESYEGAWVYVTNRYLGLQFMINGNTHYGWARLSVDMFRSEGAVTGYAYETIPNKPIIAGKTKGPDVITFQPATLGHLAKGSAGLTAWRQAQPTDGTQ